MNNEIVKSAQDALSIGKMFFESGMFSDIKSGSQAVVKIMAGQELGIPPFAAMSGIHIIQGKPTIGAGLIASTVKGSGKYDYRVLESSEKVCSIDFYQGKEMIGNSTFTIEDARRAGTKNVDKFPKNMLFARAISNGVKWFTPDVFSGPVYTPEEMNNIEQQPQEQSAQFEVIDPVKDAIDKLANCNNVDELAMLRDTLDPSIVANAAFKTAAKARYEKVKVIVAPQETAPNA